MKEQTSLYKTLQVKLGFAESISNYLLKQYDNQVYLHYGGDDIGSTLPTEYIYSKVI